MNIELLDFFSVKVPEVHQIQHDVLLIQVFGPELGKYDP